MASYYLSICLMVAVLVGTVHSYGAGAPKAVCGNMTPNAEMHGAQPQSDTGDDIPYTIYLPRTCYTSDTEKLTVKIISKKVTSLAAADTCKQIEGLLIQAKEVNSPNAQTNYGTWNLVTTGGLQMLNCSDKTNSAVTHSQEVHYRNIDLEWVPEASAKVAGKQLQIFATIVTNKQTFWVAVPSATFSYHDDCPGNPTPAPTETCDDPDDPLAGSSSSSSSEEDTNSAGTVMICTGLLAAALGSLYVFVRRS